VGHAEALSLQFDHAEVLSSWSNLAKVPPLQLVHLEVMAVQFQEIRREWRVQKVAWEEQQVELVRAFTSDIPNKL
jgi:hypothetical protein